MQNAMLDSTVSSNSQELFDASSALKLFENPQFRVRVIMRCAEPWFVAKDVATCIEHKDVSTMCRICRDKDKVVASARDFDSADLAESGNSRITLISESGLYRILAKCNLPKCEPFESWVFDEVLPSIRKTGSYSVNQPQQQSMMYLPQDYESALEALLTEVRKTKALQAELTSEKEAHEKDNEDFRNGLDIINSQKAQIGSEREATAMATASAKSRECKRLTAENAELKDAVGRGTNWHTVNMMTAEWKREFGHAPSWYKLREFSADLPEDMQPIKDVEVKVVLRNGSEKINKVFRYHREAWAKYREYEENSRVSAESRRYTKILDLEATDTEIEVF